MRILPVAAHRFGGNHPQGSGRQRDASRVIRIARRHRNSLVRRGRCRRCIRYRHREQSPRPRSGETLVHTAHFAVRRRRSRLAVGACAHPVRRRSSRSIRVHLCPRSIRVHPCRRRVSRRVWGRRRGWGRRRRPTRRRPVHPHTPGGAVSILCRRSTPTRIRIRLPGGIIPEPPDARGWAARRPRSCWWSRSR